MSGADRTAREWIRRHSLLLINAGCLLAALALAPLLIRGAALPAGGIVLVLVAVAAQRAPASSGSFRFRSEGWPVLRSQLITGVACVAAGRLFGDWPWTAFTFWPVWIGLSGCVFLRAEAPRLWRALAAAQRQDRGLFASGPQTALSGALLAAIVAFLFGRLALSEGLAWPLILGLAASWLILDRLPFARWQEAANQRSRLFRFIARLIAWTAGGAGALVLLEAAPARSLAALMLLEGLALALFGLTHRRQVVAGPENAARALLALAAAVLIHPFACHRMLGAQDAQWYMNTLADFITQVRAGVLPVFVGQSEHLFNGGVLPVRFAPLFQHYGLLLDCLTLRSLPPDALQNGVIVATFLGAAVTCWIMLARLLPGRPWLTAALCLAYLTCPGVLAVAFYEDLYMTWTTLPWLPLVFGGCVLSLGSHRVVPLLLTGASLGLLWWGHAPVALWTTLSVAAFHLARLAVLPLRDWSWRSLLWGGAACGAVALYPIVSVLSMPTQAGTGSGTIDYTGEEMIIRIVHFIRESFPGTLLPTFAQARTISDYQPGWGLLLLLGLCAAVMIHRRIRSPALWMLIVIPAALQLLLLPIPGVNRALWSVMPAFLVNPTGVWPMQRFYVIMAACLVCAAAGLLRQGGEDRPRLPVWLSCLLAAGLVWSVVAAVPVIQLKGGQRRALALAANPTLPENHVLTRYAYLYLGRQPGYYSHGHVDPLYEQRFLSVDGLRWTGGNPNAILADEPAGRVLTEGTLTARILHAGDPWQIEPGFTLEPGKRYALEIHFNHADQAGVLLVRGGDLQQIHALPRYGEKFSFGSGPESSPLLPLRTSGDNPVEVALQFAAEPGSGQTDLSRFGTYRWIEIDPDRLPVRVKGWIPFQAEIDAPADVWLETPRVFQAEYRATVNGRPVVPEKSPEGLLAVPVPAGRSTVVVDYRAPLLLQGSYWLSVAAMLACLGALLRARARTANTA